MHRITQRASCMLRYSVISLDKPAEILTALCADGTVAERNTKGYDVVSPVHGKIEVKSRVLGTDGPFPRISLSPNKLVESDSFMAVRWGYDHSLYAAIMLDRADVQPLYVAKLQASGRTSNIPWIEWKTAPRAFDFTKQFADLIAAAA